MNLKKFVYLLLFDQITKILAFRDFFDFCTCITPTKNQALFFGLSLGKYDLPVLLILFSLLIGYLVKLRNISLRKTFPVCLLLAGASSNLLDRIVLGFVRDFINIGLVTVNFADAYLLLGVLGILMHRRQDK